MSEIGVELEHPPRGRLLKPLKTVLGGLGDLLLPPVCIHCRAPIDVHGQLCGACWSDIDFIAAPFCDRLGIPLPYDSGGDGAIGRRTCVTTGIRPGARCRGLCRDHARSAPKLQIS